MLKKKHRLGKKTRDQKVSVPPQSFTTPYFSLSCRKNELDHGRFRFVISKKVDKRAVVRNALKRRMSTAVSMVSESFRGQDTIFYLKKTALEVSAPELQKALEDLRLKI